MAVVSPIVDLGLGSGLGPGSQYSGHLKVPLSKVSNFIVLGQIRAYFGVVHPGALKDDPTPRA